MTKQENEVLTFQLIGVIMNYLVLLSGPGTGSLSLELISSTPDIDVPELR